MANSDNERGNGVRRKRTPKFTAGKQKKYLGLLATGHRRQASARASGISHDTVERLMRKSKVFRARVDEAEMSANEVVEDRLYRRASDGHFGSQVFWLCNRDPERWKDVKRLELTGADGGPMGIEQMLETLKGEREQIKKHLAAELLEERGGLGGASP